MSSSLSRSFEGFRTLFGEAAPEQGSSSASGPPPPPPPHHSCSFVFRALPLDALRLELVASDFASTAFRRVFTVDELEDIRDDVGLGGTWVEFVEYVAKSLGSDGVKLVIPEGARMAKLIAHMSKGMPRITLVLNRVVDSSASDVIADLSLSLYTAFRDRDKDATKAHARCDQLTGLLSSEKGESLPLAFGCIFEEFTTTLSQDTRGRLDEALFNLHKWRLDPNLGLVVEKTENLQKQLDSFTFKSKRKAPKDKGSRRQAPGASVVDTQIGTMQPSGEKLLFGLSLCQDRTLQLPGTHGDLDMFESG